MKTLSAFFVTILVSNVCFAVAPFSGRRDYKVGDKEVYSRCIIRAQFDQGIELSKERQLEVCNATMQGADLTGVRIVSDLNGYSKTTVNCLACPAVQE